MAKPLHPLCPCGAVNSKKKQNRYDECCGVYLSGHQGARAADALSLMRSRFTAYVVENSDYLLNTWASEYRPKEIVFEHDIKWLSLEIKTYGCEGEDFATVEFVARYRQNGKGGRMHEVSRFVRREGCWYYLNGQVDEA